ncbi:shikimate dehydrogenase [Ramlibacter sp.]|uniref:shikimate dehydrogenase family protein n=1 Tax=Ramlibacter sp. TaxID=1917967 RepID=UPI0017F2585B|nr:shikimate dehydrogenase [Ramlibacter sp.]MBA2672541.1 shikimate dehydrogenase [Ramlibacter sp.]
MRIDGDTEVIAHLGYPTHSFKAPLIYNPYFAAAGINALVVPMACRTEDFATVLPALFRMDNVRGALVTMPHKVSVLRLLDATTPAVQIAGACNAVKRLPDGTLLGDQFDGEGFVRGVRGKGFDPRGKRALVVGCGGVGCAIATSLAATQPAAMALHDLRADMADGLARRLQQHYPQVEVTTGSKDPAGFDLVVNCTPLGMQAGDPLPFDVERLGAGTFVGEVVLSQAMTPLLQAAQARGCRVQVGTDMLFEMIPAYLEFFGLPATTPARLRELATLDA